VRRKKECQTKKNEDSEEAFRLVKASRESYHGGAFNGVDCIRITENAEAMFAHLEGRLLELRDGNLLTEEEVKNHIEKYRNLFDALDGIWSNVRGVECGLLPTEENLEYLDGAIAKGKELWLELNISITQPKWHLLFDGHLLNQVREHRGLADICPMRQSRRAIKNRNGIKVASDKSVSSKSADSPCAQLLPAISTSRHHLRNPKDRSV